MDDRASSGSQPVPEPGGFVFASMGRRFVAWAIDTIIVYALAVVGSLLITLVVGAGRLPPDLWIVAIGVVSGAYFIGSWLGSRRATLGQRWLKIAVHNAADGRTLSAPQAILRLVIVGYPLILAPFVGAILNGAVTAALVVLALILLGTSAMSKTGQGLHDRLASSLVVQPAAIGSSAAATVSLLLATLVLVGYILFVLVDLGTLK